MNDELPWDDGSHDDPRRGPPADDNHLHQPADDSLPLPDDLRALFEALVEGRITPERAEVLNALLIDNPEVRRQYVHYVQLHSDLIHGGLTHADFGQSELAGGDAARSSPSSNLNAAPAPCDTTPASSQTPSMLSSIITFPLALPLALVCLAVFVLGVYLGGQLRREVADNATPHAQLNADRNVAASTEQESGAESAGAGLGEDLPQRLFSKPAPFATLVEAGGCQWSGSTLPTLAGSRLSSGSLRLKQGRAHVGFDNGAQVFLEGPAVFYLHDANRAHLESGRIMAHVPQQAIGFTIETQTTDIVDLGTEFGVEVTPSGATEVQVLEGEVELGAPRGEDRQLGPTALDTPPTRDVELPRQKLLVGQARRLDSPPLAGWQEVAFTPDEFRKLRPQTDRAAGSPWWPVVVDDFNDNQLNPKSWKVVTEGIPYGAPNIFEMEGSLTLVDRANLVTAQEFDPVRLGGIRITGRWTFRTEGDVFEVLTRSDGQPGGQYGDTLTGASFLAVMQRGTSPVGILGRGDCKVDLKRVDNLQINVGDVFEFEVLDVPGGLSLKLWEASGSGPKAHVFTNQAPPRMARNRVVFHNRNAHRAPQYASLDNVVIEQAIRPVSLGPDGELRIGRAENEGIGAGGDGAVAKRNAGKSPEFP